MHDLARCFEREKGFPQMRGRESVLVDALGLKALRACRFEGSVYQVKKFNILIGSVHAEQTST